MFTFARMACIGALLIHCGCAATVVKKDPGPHDRGIRYWRPKPYLMVAPAAVAEKPSDLVNLSITYLPDYNEEYSIHVRAGIGTNATKVTLDNGWNLTNMEVSVDSKVTELITALSGAATAAAQFRGQKDGSAFADLQLTVCAHKVPLGLYEAVVQCDAHGNRKLCGWRYIGFAPFGGCNTTIAECNSPESSELYGLVSFDGQPRFCKLSDLGKTPANVIKVPITSGPDAAKPTDSK